MKSGQRLKRHRELKSLRELKSFRKTKNALGVVVVASAASYHSKSQVELESHLESEQLS